MTHFGGYIDWGLAWLRKSRTKTAPWHVFCAAEERLHGYGDRGTCPTGFVTIHWQLRPELGEGATTNINCLQKTWVSTQLLAMLTLWSILPLGPSGPWVTGCSSRICGCATHPAASALTDLDTQIAGFHGNMMEYGQHVSSFLTHHFHFGLKRNRQFAIWIFFPPDPISSTTGCTGQPVGWSEAWWGMAYPKMALWTNGNHLSPQTWCFLFPGKFMMFFASKDGFWGMSILDPRG